MADGGADERYTPRATYRLDVSLEYVGNVNVDVDNIFIRTPNLRAMMREMYRDTLEAAADTAITKTMARATTLSMPLTRILGLRTMEERGENSWWAQRYMAILLNGMTITETNYRPFDRWNHIAYPLGSGDPIGVDWRSSTPQRVITWTEQAIGRTKPGMAAPFLRYGQLYTTTLGMGFGVCKHQHTKNYFACHCGSTDAERRRMLDAYEIGFNGIYNHIYDFATATKNLDSLEYSHPHECADSTIRYVWPHEFSPLHSVEYYLYHNFIESGNRTALFGDKDWLEQVWLGGTKKTPAYVASGDTLNRFVVLSHFESQGRPTTAEEIRLRLTLPTILASSGLVYYFGPGPILTYNPTTNSIPNPDDYFGDVINYRETNEAGLVDTDTILAHYRGDEYGADYPVLPGSGEAHTYVKDGSTRTAEVKLPDYVLYRHQGIDTTLLPLWIDLDPLTDVSFNDTCTSAGYEDIVGGYDIVRRVDLSDSTLRSGVSVGERLYFGARSVRNEIIDYTEQVGRICDTVGTDKRWRDVFRELDLGAWRAKGFKRFDLRDEVEYPSSNPLAAVISLDEVRTRHPYRTSNARADYEDKDSSFYDLTYLTRRSNPDVYGTYRTDEFWLGVQNRRTSPLYLLPDSLQEDPNAFFAFSSGVEFAALSSKENSGIRSYDQLGARAIILPFKYVKAGEGPKLLHITEMGVDPTEGLPREFASRRLIDTVVDAFANWEVLLRPGEGKLFRIQIIDASDTAAIGNLAFNTQTKMVLAREQVIDTNVASKFALTDKLRYHIVYMRDKGGGQGHRVYYKRSHAYAQEQLPNVIDLVWDSEIEIGNDIRLRPENPIAFPAPPRTLDQTGTGLFGTAPYAYGFDRTWTNVDNGEPSNDQTTLCGFFPTITVSRKVNTVFPTSGPPVVSAEQFVTIAYSALVERNSQNREIHIAQVQFRDTPQGTTPTIGVARTLSVTRRDDPTNGINFNVDTMALWGTPTNATTTILPAMIAETATPDTVPHDDYVFTAWSVRPTIGITNGSKACAGASAYYLPTEYEVLPITQSGTLAQYPSLSPYSVVTTSFPSAAATLVWQETDEVPEEDSLERYGNIMYTRVYRQLYDPAQTHHVPKSELLHYVTWTFPPSDTLVPFNNGQIYRVSQTASGVSSLYPTVVRGGKVDGPWPDSRSLASKLKLYNELDCESEEEPREIDMEYEYLAWQETLQGASNSRVRRRYFLMDAEQGLEGPGDTMRIWSMNTVAHTYQSCAVPVVSLAAMRIDSQLFSLGSSDPLVYSDPDYCRMQITGNISDTSVFCAFGLFVNTVNGPGPVGAVHWSTFHSGWPSTGPMVVQHPHRFAPFSGYTSNFLRVNSFAPGGAEISRDPGQWPHVAHRAFGVTPRREELRRVQEIDNTAHIMFTSEFYMKPTAESVVNHYFKGFVHNGEELVVRCADPSGIDIEFGLEEDDRYVGAGLIMRHLAQPVYTIVSEPIRVTNDVELTFDNIGALRKGVELSIEEVGSENSKVSLTSTHLSLDAPIQSDDATERNQSQRTTYVLTNGDSKSYRMRLTVPEGSIMNEVTILDAETESQGKITRNNNVKVVDLASGRVRSRADAAKPLVYPNPASTELHIIPPSRSTGEAKLVVDIVDGLGRVLATWAGAYTSVIVLPVEHLQSGMYSVRTTWACGEQASVPVAIQR